MANHPSSKDRRNTAREQARQIAAAQAKKEKTVKTILYVGIAVVVVAVMAVVGTLVWQSSRPVAPPQAMVSGTLAFAAGDDGIQAVQPAGEEEGADVSDLPTVADSGAAEGAAVVKVYLDFQCPGCKAFEEANGQTLASLAEDGSIVLEYEPVAILDRMSGGNEYSTRSSNMAACIADSGQSELLPDVMLELFAQQPGEGQTGMEDDQLLSIAESAGVDVDAEVAHEDAATVRDCVTEVAFDRYVENSTQDALNSEGVQGTPHITVDGEPYEGDWSNREAFAADLIRASGQN